MSATSGSNATPNSTQDGDSTIPCGIKVATPDLFYGDRTKLEDWLLQFDMYFTFQGSELDDNCHVSLVATFMRGAALQWIKPFLVKYMASEAPKEVNK
jgi:hypothetical protein